MTVGSCCLTVALLIISLLPAQSHSHGHDNDQRKKRSPREGPTIDEVLTQGDAEPFAGPESGRSFGGEDRILDGYDMLMTPAQYQRLYKGAKARDGGRSVATTWTDGVIPYFIKEGEFNSTVTERIKAAMLFWEEVSCIKFRENTTDDVNVVIIQRGSNNRCTSDLGMRGMEQTINLASFCLELLVLYHELAHTLGLIHEHQRPQRDGYVRINYYALERGGIGWLTKYAKGSEDKMGLKYDYSSIMHYGPYSFSSDGKQVIYTRDPAMKEIIGNGKNKSPSFLDIKLLNLMYNCPDRCKSPPTECGDDCFVTKNCSCHCDTHDKPDCVDSGEYCAKWARKGWCDTVSSWMFLYCRKSCGGCDDGACEDTKADCKTLAANGECNRDPDMMLSHCKASCDFCHDKLGDDPTAKPGCVDYDFVCQLLADDGMCQTLNQSMTTECAQHCGTCGVDVTLPDYCVDTAVHCWMWAVSGFCRHGRLDDICPRSCSSC